MSDNDQNQPEGIKLVVRHEPSVEQLADWVCAYLSGTLNTRVPFTYYDITQWLRSHYPEFNILHTQVKELAMGAVEIYELHGLVVRSQGMRGDRRVNEFTPVLPANFPAFPVKSA